ncbi:hypothetical protein IBE20_04475 [Francisella tularensis subsp. novicida]|uniref:Uncharacterized protein n=2 Tax=Francisella tularensis TaxID=263 RepID=A0A6I4RUV6_FRATU|nr:type VI secretion system protein IglI family protein [Francisella tularensis]ABK88956.1 protein of unknown function [Francisella tularensis subsp. novicida U112]AJI60756.1 hypothetical protein AW25_155 [Francisella tularensis subsp. novicida U112]EDX19349.1 hypothetical protein FTE_0337 [Francisella tularensis subsp. novicida FTE]MBK2036012.1 hypothetical protein [Francisella tularensis subsp. novicida]MBK2115938.1 hypothetical protein [Francisella tularensis subsp. novicida]
MSKASKELQNLFDVNDNWQVIKRSNFEVLTESTEFLESRKFQEVINIIYQYVYEEKVLDIQLFCLYLQAHFNLHNSADDLLSILETLVVILSKYELISPLNKKETILVRSITTLINEVDDAVNYYYPDFLDNQRDLIKNYLDKTQELLNLNINDIDLSEFNKSKNQLLSTVAKYLLKQDSANVVEEIVVMDEKDTSTKKIDKEDRYSFYWTNLLLKISKFRDLAKVASSSTDSFNLALLFDSIQTEIKSFDPVKYFPREFGVFLNSVTPEVYIDIQNIIEKNKGSSLWDFMLQKADTSIQMDPENKQSEIGDYNVDDLLRDTIVLKSPNNNSAEKNNNDDAKLKNPEDDFSSAFDILDL